ncbi:MAG: hypothetical protein IJA65_05880, partial [Acholeplasmatales bacterium]|nr:hypothetical protein [Acholeplasmatales bacterium]
LPKMRIKRIGYFFYDLIFNHKGKVKAKDYIYHSKMDTRLLNMTKKEYEINYVKYNYSFEEVINNTLDETMVYINAINDYLFLNKEKGLKKAFNINDEFEL